MSLKDELRKLIELQYFDTEIHSLKEKKNIEKPQELEDLKNAFEKRKQQFSSFQEKVKQSQLKRKELELDLSSKEGNVRKAQGDLYQLKTNKEYQVKLREIESLKADASLLEEDVINVLDKIEEEENKVNEEKEKLAGEENDFREKEKKIKEELKSLEIEIKGLEDKRKIMTDTIDRNIFSAYERLIAIRSGLAIAAADTEHCGACHIRITAQQINEIKMYKDLVMCENCVRILYIKEDLL